MKSHAKAFGFHNLRDANLQMTAAGTSLNETQFTYTFENFYHPFVGDLIKELNKNSLAGMLDPVFLEGLDKSPVDKDPPNSFFKLFRDYEDPDNTGLVLVEGSPLQIDLSESGPYSGYNWELLFHIPLTIAVHLSKNQRFAEAQRWFHYIFNPTSNDTSVPPPQRFWNFLAFRRNNHVTQIDELLALLSKPDSECTPEELDLKGSIVRGYENIKDKPFQPHAVARTRHLAYRYSVVMKYLDNLIAWGDSLFRQDTIESINEATQRYVLAANILGPRPQRIPPSGTVRAKTFAQLKSQGLDEMGNALVELEAQFPFNFGLPQTQGDPNAPEPLFGIGRTLYFCIPPNEKLLGYWDTVADRLFKIRHCMNIEGVVRQLALFDPPIDPGMLVKAAAAGINLGSIVSGLNQPIGPMRCLFMIQKALELIGEVRGLGNALLAAIEKSEGERLALLRQGHEIKIQEMQQEIRFLQWQQAQESTESLLRSRSTALERYRYYQRLLGLTPDSNSIPDTFMLDGVRGELTEENFEANFEALVGVFDKPIAPEPFGVLTKAADPSFDIGAPLFSLLGGFESGKLYLNSNEDAELNKHLPRARDMALLSSAANALAAGFAPIPDPKVDIHFWGIGGTVDLKVGTALVAAAKITGDILNITAGWEREQAGMASRTASYERRADEWILQNNLAARELMQIGRQLIGSLIAEQIAHHEYLNIQKQIEQAQETDRFMHEKFTSEELYSWMQGELSRLYYEYYRFAFDTARKAEQTMKRELMRPEVDNTDYIKFNYWDGGRKGLLSGEGLHLDLKRMEMAYHENNKREYELTRHVSLRQLDPLALLTLKATGTCEVNVPEWLFDLDNPGHYMRRIKNVSLSLPSVAGPYTNVGCTLSLLKSSIRKSPLGEYKREDNDDRFIDYLGTIQSIVTSTGNNDAGMFETNLRDERFLPFEGAGAESTWRLELPKEFRQFDYDTISDVVLHVRYTARQGGDTLKNNAVGHLKELVGEVNNAPLGLLLSLRHDFPVEWHRFVTGDADFSAMVKRDHFPYFAQTRGFEIKEVIVHTIKDGAVGSSTITPGPDPFTLSLGENIVERKKDANVFVVIKYSMTS